MKNAYWIEQEKGFIEAIKSLKIPNATLEEVDFNILKSIENIENIPSGGGCYWIWTNEPIIHSLHKNRTPEKFDDGEIIYNGIAKDDVKGRIKQHLFADMEADWSGISVDIYMNKSESHRKKAFSVAKRVKVPYINHQPIKTIDKLLELHLSEEEKYYIEKNRSETTFYFRNGVNLNDEKHKNYEYRVYHIIGLRSIYLEYIEKQWRAEFGLPRLCSYSSGR